MTDRAALLAAIGDRPEDDTPRLVLADWLDDNDDPDRAAYIRAAVACDRIPIGDARKQNAWAAEYAAQGPGKRWWSWYGPGDRVHVLNWERGFVSALATTAATWLEFADQILGEHPTLRRVTLTTPVATYCTGRDFEEYQYTLLFRGPAHPDGSLRVRLPGAPPADPRDALAALWPRITFTLPPPARTHQYSHWEEAIEAQTRQLVADIHGIPGISVEFDRPRRR